MTKTLREHLQIHKKLSKAILYESSIMALCFCLMSVSEISFDIFMLGLVALPTTFIAEFVYRQYLKSKFGKTARRVFFSIDTNSGNNDMFDTHRNHAYSSYSFSQNQQIDIFTDRLYNNLHGNIYNRD